MSVYVEECRILSRGMYWAHMTADTLSELHKMAQQIGLKRRWFQDTKHPHYDVVDKYRTRALYYGAKAVKSCLIAMREAQKAAPLAPGNFTTDNNTTNNSAEQPGAPVSVRDITSIIGYCKTGLRKRVIETGEVVTLRDFICHVSGHWQYWACEFEDGYMKMFRSDRLQRATPEMEAEDRERIASAEKLKNDIAHDARIARLLARNCHRTTKTPQAMDTHGKMEQNVLWTPERLENSSREERL